MQAGNMHTHFIPRVGQEVVVTFMEGNIDKPICSGMHYNTDNKPPHDLPSKHHMSGIKTRTVGSNNPEESNELRFEDNPKQENIYIQAQNTLNIKAKGNEKQHIGHDLKSHVKANQTISIGGDAKVASPNAIILKAGSGEIHISPDSITMKGAKISMGEVGSIATNT